MTERIVNSTWWLVVMGMICACGSAALLIGYRGLFELLAGRLQSAGVGLACSVACGAGTWALCRHRNDLL